MGICCSTDDEKKLNNPSRIFIDDDLGVYDRRIMEEVGICSFCKNGGVFVLYKWIGARYVYMCEYCETELNNRGIRPDLEEII